MRGLNWDNARGECLSYGGDLVSVANKSEMDFIYSKSSQVRNELYWIGLNDRRNESLFVWSDGTPYNGSVYNNWHPNEPNDRAGEDCVELHGRKWNDDSCKKEYSYICERPKGMLNLFQLSCILYPPRCQAQLQKNFLQLFPAFQMIIFLTLSLCFLYALMNLLSSYL